MIDLSAPGVLAKLGTKVLNEIDKAAVQIYNEGPRNHLGASIIGSPCSRQLWFEFRWAKHIVHDGRQYRLFNRGHKEEARFIEWLNIAGFSISDINPATGKQWRISGVKGHFGGSLDGKIKFPESFDYNETLLLEFKTNGTGASFNKLLTHRVAVAKPVHFDQMCVYGYKEQLQYALYLNVCKNDDNIHSEVVKLDWKRGEELERKAIMIIEAKEAPPRISNQRTNFDCKYCDFKEVCFDNAPLDKNCRSCINAVAVEDARWFCNKWGNVIPVEFVPVGCNEWSRIYEA